METESDNSAHALAAKSDASDPPPVNIVAAVEQNLPIAALNDWITFLQGPSGTLFTEDSSFDAEWKRLFRLVTLVLLMLGAIIAIFSIGLNAAGQSWRDFASSSKYLLLILVVGAVVAVPYAFVLAPLLRIRITFCANIFHRPSFGPAMASANHARLGHRQSLEWRTVGRNPSVHHDTRSAS